MKNLRQRGMISVVRRKLITSCSSVFTTKKKNKGTYSKSDAFQTGLRIRTFLPDPEYFTGSVSGFYSGYVKSYKQEQKFKKMELLHIYR